MPSHFYIETEVRKALPNPGGFGVKKGYWVARPPHKQSALQGYTDLTLTILYVHKTLRNAEDHALRAGRTFSSLTSAFGGYPLDPPRLHRIATVDVSDRLVSQHDYHYDNQLHESLGRPFEPITQHRYQRYLEFSTSADENTTYRLQSAMHWYGIAIGAEDPTVSYVASWTGLECIGSVMDGRFHKHGPKAPCLTCGNQAGKERDRTIAGIEHLFKSGILESKEGFLHEQAHKLRNDTVHGLRESESLMQDCSEFVRYLIDLLTVSISTVLTPPKYSEDSAVKLLVAGDYEFHPCSRASIKFSEGQTFPYLEEWIEGNLCRESERGTRGKGKADLVVGIEYDWTLRNSQLESVESISYEEFKRLGQVEYPLSDQPMAEFIPWRGRPSAPVWKDAPMDHD